MISEFKTFLDDSKSQSMYITGAAGTGKTHSLNELVSYCIDANISYIVCAFTHKACRVLANELPISSNILTLHKYLKKRPVVNSNAIKIRHIETSIQQGQPDKKSIMFLDEFSMVGEKDYMDIIALQDSDNKMKVVYIGDLNQLPPVGDRQTINPSLPYWVKLVHLYRTDKPGLLSVLNNLVRYIQGETPKHLKPNDSFMRTDTLGLVSAFVNHHKVGHDVIMLAYTNARVEELNCGIHKTLEEGDNLRFSPTLHKYIRTIGSIFENSEVNEITLAYNEDTLASNSKYQTLEHLKTMKDIMFVEFADAEDSKISNIYACIHGHYQHKAALNEYKHLAVEANKAIRDKYGIKANIWAKENKGTKLAKKRSKAWKDYLTFKECVICIDYPYVTTVHKSQGSTYDYVCIDTNNIAICAEHNYKLYLKLLYVAISRASIGVYTN